MNCELSKLNCVSCAYGCVVCTSSVIIFVAATQAKCYSEPQHTHSVHTVYLSQKRDMVLADLRKHTARTVMLDILYVNFRFQVRKLVDIGIMNSKYAQVKSLVPEFTCSVIS